MNIKKATALLSIKEVALILKVSTDTINKLIKENKLKAIRVGKRWRVPNDFLDSLMNDGREAQPEDHPDWSKQARKHLKGRCEYCQTDENLVAHHIDEDHWNNEASNIQTLCETCHRRWHTICRRNGISPAGRLEKVKLVAIRPNK